MARELEILECDVVIVGAGSAGAAVASRLTASANCDVVLLEAGPDYRADQTPDALASIDPLRLLADDDLTSTYMFPELMASRSSTQGPGHYRRGRGVGGSSAINGLFAVRPTVEDMDEWADGRCTGWSFAEVLPVLRRLETDYDFGDADFHGDHGPLPVRRPGPTELSPLDVAFREACLGAGHSWAPDHNAPGSTGLSPYAYNGRGNRRISTNDAYLEPARPRPNLRILGDTLVDQVVFAGSVAVGVRAERRGTPLEVRAGQVVLSAGAIHTPAVLLRSGVGPASDLKELGVAVRADLPVGLGLQDHPAVAMLTRLDEKARSNADGRHAGFCLRFDTAAGQEPNGAMVSATAMPDEEVGALIGWVNRVESTGQVRLKNVDPTVDPIVEMNMLSSPVDRRRMRTVLDELASLSRSAPFREVGQNLGLLSDPAGGSTIPIEDALSDPDLERLLSDAVFDVSHATSTCRMGDPTDGTTVVDPTGGVHGLQSLWVADASVFPWVPRANTHISAVLVGEKIADAVSASGHYAGSEVAPNRAGVSLS